MTLWRSWERKIEHDYDDPRNRWANLKRIKLKRAEVSYQIYMSKLKMHGEKSFITYNFFSRWRRDAYAASKACKKYLEFQRKLDEAREGVSYDRNTPYVYLNS